VNQGADMKQSMRWAAAGHDLQWLLKFIVVDLTANVSVVSRSDWF